MPYRSEKIKIEGTEFDARKKITGEMERDILGDKGKLSQRVTARKYGISRRSVVFIWYPERREKNKEQYKIRRMDGRYYKKEKHTKAIRKHRSRKQKLYKEGLIKLKQ